MGLAGSQGKETANYSLDILSVFYVLTFVLKKTLKKLRRRDGQLETEVGSQCVQLPRTVSKQTTS